MAGVWGFDSEKSAKAVARAARLVLNGSVNAPRYRPQRQNARPTGIPIYNNSGTTIPAWGVCKPSTQSGGVVTVVKPDTTLVESYLLNGPESVANGEYGLAMPFGDIRIAHLSGASIGDSFGVAASSFTLTENGPTLFRIIGDDSDYTRGIWSPITTLLGKPDADIAKGSSGTVSIYAGPGGSEADTTINLTCYALGADVKSGKWVTIDFINGVPYVGPWECS